VYERGLLGPILAPKDCWDYLAISAMDAGNVRESYIFSILASDKK
jgi:hypothetical protein